MLRFVDYDFGCSSVGRWLVGWLANWLATAFAAVAVANPLPAPLIDDLYWIRIHSRSQTLSRQFHLDGAGTF